MSGSLSPNALLQARVLCWLERETVRNLSELSRRLGAPRPSVSRVMSALENKNLVEKNKRRWRLTEAGAAAVGEARDILERAFPQGSEKPLIEPPRRQGRPYARIADALERIADALERERARVPASEGPTPPFRSDE